MLAAEQRSASQSDGVAETGLTKCLATSKDERHQKSLRKQRSLTAVRLRTLVQSSSEGVLQLDVPGSRGR